MVKYNIKGKEVKILEKKERIWISNRLSETANGTVIVPSYVIKKYRKLLEIDDSVPNKKLKDEIIYRYY